MIGFVSGTAVHLKNIELTKTTAFQLEESNELVTSIKDYYDNCLLKDKSPKYSPSTTAVQEHRRKSLININSKIQLKQ